MNWFEVFIKYWAQIAVLLAIIGYILQAIFNYRLKKKEIFFSLYAKSKIDAYTNFIELYYKASDTLIEVIGKFDNTPDSSHIPVVKQIQAELLNACYKLHLFLDQTSFDKCQKATLNYMELCGKYVDLVNDPNGKVTSELYEKLTSVNKLNHDLIAESSELFKKKFEV